jgi:hypothetical protein
MRKKRKKKKKKKRKRKRKGVYKLWTLHRLYSSVL